MRATDLIGLDVYDPHGEHLGVVIDLRCIQDGPLRGAMATLRVDSLLVSRRRTGAQLGYQRRTQQGPWLLRAALRRLHGIPWSFPGLPSVSTPDRSASTLAAPNSPQQPTRAPPREPRRSAASRASSRGTTIHLGPPAAGHGQV
jgi:hypothetical protein